MSLPSLSRVSSGDHVGSPLPYADATTLQDNQELSQLLLEADQVMLALRQVPTVNGSSSSSLGSTPLRSMLQKVQSWVEHNQVSSLDTASTSQPPCSPLSHHSLATSDWPTLGQSDSEMMDFIPALALPAAPVMAAPQSITRAVDIPQQHKGQPGPVVPVVESNSDSSVSATRLPLSAHRSSNLSAPAMATGRDSLKPGSSTDTLPGPPATPFSAASDSDAVGPSTPSNSFAQGSGGMRPLALPATVRTHKHLLILNTCSVCPKARMRDLILICVA